MFAFKTIIFLLFTLQPRKWPELTLKSPGIKPARRHNNSNSSMSLSNTLPFGSKASHFLNSSEGEQSPPANSNNHLPASEFSVFANVNIPVASSSSSSFFTSQSTLNSTFMPDDTISITSTIAAPEIPRRSNSIISMTSHNNNSFSNHFDNNHKPLLSPRMFQQQQQQQHQSSSVSPAARQLDSLVEDFRSLEMHHHHQQQQQNIEQTSPSFHKPNPYQRSAGIIRANITESNETSERSSPGFNYNHPSSPRYNATELNESNGPLPISPHVNVPNSHSFNHHHMPPPLPPRRRYPKKNPHDYISSQLRQAADAPILLPRDMETDPPPPLPPRINSGSSRFNTWNHTVKKIIN
jgi:son of sevenless-like protein